MYASLVTCYLVGAKHSYRGELQLPGTGERQSIKRMLERVVVEVDHFIEHEAAAGKYECGVYFEQVIIADRKGANHPWWMLMVNLNATLSMTWCEDVQGWMLEGGEHHG